MAIIVLIIGLAGPAFNALKSANDVNKSVYDIAGVLQVARSYAMANNTYVYAGIEEVSAGLDASVSPQVSGTGRVGLAIVATKDGTRGYELSDLANGGINPVTFLANLNAVGAIQVFENLHLADLGTPPATGSMARPTLTTDASSGFRYELAVAACTSVTPFNYPLGATGSAAKYSFQKVIQFDPQGVARIQTLNNADTVTSTLEIGLQQSHGTAVSTLTPPVSTGAVAALQIDAVTGSVHIYRP
jgi:hypothetical protein